MLSVKPGSLFNGVNHFFILHLSAGGGESCCKHEIRSVLKIFRD